MREQVFGLIVLGWAGVMFTAAAILSHKIDGRSILTDEERDR